MTSANLAMIAPLPVQFLCVFQSKLYVRVNGDWFFMNSMGMLSDSINRHTITKLDLHYAEVLLRRGATKADV